MTKVDDTIQNIMEATVRVAFDKGFANTRTSDIAKEAGVSEGLIFKYFPTKNHLFAIIIKGVFQRIKAGADVIINNPALTANAKIEALIDFHFDFFSQPYNCVYLIFGHSDWKIISNLEPVIEHGIKPYLQLIAKVFKEGIIKGEFRPLDPEVIAMSLIGSMQFNIFAKLLAGSQENLEAIKMEIKEYTLAGIRR